MNFCPNCGVKAPDTARFCRVCGAALESQNTKPSASPPPLPTPQPASAAAVPELETPPPPPVKGVSVTWQRGKQGLTRRVDMPSTVAVEPGSAVASAPPSAGNSSSAATVWTSILAGFGKEQVNLPPTPPIWGFRQHTSAFADKLVKGIVPQNQEKPNPFIDCLAHIIRGALMHKDVYRTAASNGSLTTEAICVAVALIIISTVGLNVGILLGNGSTFLVKAMIARAAGWIGAAIAIHYVAKQWQQVALPPVAWFRGLIYAQSAVILSIVPSLGGLASIWGAICTIAALQDVSGKDIKVGIALLLVAGVAVAIVTYCIGSLPS